MATLKTTSGQQPATVMQHSRKVRHARLPITIRLSKSEYESLMQEMQEAARLIRAQLKAACNPLHAPQ